jgi:hypothetical protein
MGFLAELKKLVYDQTQKLGVVVGNIYGAAQPTLEKLTSVEQSAWLVLTIPSRSVASIDNFYALYSALATAAAQSIPTTTGAVVYQYSGQGTVTALLRGTVDLVQARSITLAVDTGDDAADFIVQLDGHVVRQGTGSREIGIYLDAGSHVIEVMAASNVLGVQAPADIRISASFERVPTPTWSSVTTGYLDAVQGAATVGLSWYVDPKAGGWRIMRRQLSPVSAIVATDVVDTVSEYSVQLTGLQTTLLTGQELFAAHELMGVVLSTRFEGSDTFVRLRIPPGRTGPSLHWAGQTAMTGTFIEIQRVGRTQAAGVMTWNDNSVKARELYDYALQAWGFLDSNTWSAVSAVQTVCAGDTDAPASVVFEVGYPTVIDRVVRAKFTTPSDIDYAGVRVYYRQSYTGTATAGGASSITNSGASFLTLDASWIVRIVAGTGLGQERQWASNTGTSITVSSPWLTIPDNTSQYLVFKDSILKTDYGLPSAIDQFEFEPISTDPADPAQEYQFRTFDAGLNEQLDSVCVSWVFDPGADGSWTSPPIVGIRQVPATHPTLVGQDDFVAPFNNPKNYAVVELSASDVAGRRGAITISYQRRGDSSPVTLPATANPTTEGGTPALLDNPFGTRSRYVAIDRTTGDNWIKVYAQDADGNKSDTLTYAVDYNDDPEISSLESRVDPASVFTAAWNAPGITNLWFGSGTLGTTGVVWVTGSGDDDSRALKYWFEDATGSDPTQGAPRTLDLSANRAFAFAVTLGDGQRKKLIIQPWSEYSGGTATGTAGVQVEREFTRPARSLAHFEDKDADGNVSGKTVKGSFDVLPIPNVQTPVAVGSVLTAHASASTATTLKDSGSPAWTVNQWATSGTRKFFVIAKNGSVIQTRTVVSNTADTVIVSPAWTTIPHSALFWVVDSAVMYRLDESGAFLPTAGMVLDTGAGVYKPASGAVFFDRKTGDAVTIVEYFASKNKVPDEGAVRLTVDADTIPEFGDLNLQEISPNDLRVTLVAPDDDVKLWRAYRRKGAWPTVTGTLPTPFTSAALDRKYLHHTDVVQNLSYDSYAGTGQQYVVVVPTNSMNQDGPPVSKTVAVSGNLATPQLSNLRVQHVDAGGGSNASNRVEWDHPNIPDADTTYHVKVYGYRKVTATGAIDIASTELTPGGFTRLVTYDSEAGSDFINTDDSQTISGEGSWVHDTSTFRVTAVGGVAYTWVYSVELYNPSNVLVGTYTVEDTDYYLPPVCAIATAAVSVLTNGSESGGFCESDPSNSITWTVTVPGDDSSAVWIEGSFDVGSVIWEVVAAGIRPSTGNYVHQLYGIVFGGSTDFRWYKYRVWTRNVFTGVDTAKVSTTQLSETVDFCSSGGV